MHTFHSIDTVGDIDNATMFPTEFLHSLNLSGLPEHKLKLKINTVVILVWKMDICAGHCNGTRYLVKVIGQYRIILHRLDARDDDKSKVLILPQIPYHYGGKSFPFYLAQLQFPLKIVFAQTINRARGQSAKNVAFCSQRMFGCIFKCMLLSLSMGTPTTFSYGQSIHISKTAREEGSLGRNISKM